MAARPRSFLPDFMPDESAEEMSPAERGRIWTRWMCVGAIILSIGLIATVAAFAAGRRSLDVLGIEGTYAAVVAALVVMIAVTVLALTLRGALALLALVPAAACVVVGFITMLVAPNPLVEVKIANCRSPYVVGEGGGFGTIYRREGLVLEELERFHTDDWYAPFTTGEYAASADEHHVELRFFLRSPLEPLSLSEGPVTLLPLDGVVCE
ncbi:hypothetical protein BKA24_001536 [Microbacterium marinum]|uniref:Uncharacterized protein n=1 Tax=Microbacterium marinum TaxID=421115 RepID=A0A7W7BQ95_9MICO|nr:hypothetical protein [Microbacterium marinum]MBB4666827.1 hypothetical protein [Microbacterium marinum]